MDRSSPPTAGLVLDGKKQEVVLALVISLSVKVLHELTDRTPQRGFAEEDQFR
jgi:transcriptional regulator of met regulon